MINKEVAQETRDTPVTKRRAADRRPDRCGTLGLTRVELQVNGFVTGVSRILPKGMNPLTFDRRERFHIPG
jgi:hypothetical protein